MIVAHGAVGVCDGAHSGFVMKKDRRVGLRDCGCSRHPLIAKNAMSGHPADLKTITVPTLIVIGGEDVIATVADGELMRQNIAGSQLKVIPKAGHYAPWEQSEAVGMVFRQFLDYVIDNPLTNH